MDNELGVSLAGTETQCDWENELPAGLTAAAGGGDPKAHFSLVLMSVTKGVGSPADGKKWLEQCAGPRRPHQYRVV
jgi:hypothetical protein